MKGRGILVGLDESLADHIAALPVPAGQVDWRRAPDADWATVLRLGDDELDVIEFDCQHVREMLDVTSFNDAAPQFMAGLSRTDVSIVALAKGRFAAGVSGDVFALFDGPVALDVKVGGDTRVRATVVVREVQPSIEVGGLLRLRLAGVVSGRLEFYGWAEAPPPPRRRGISLGGL